MVGVPGKSKGCHTCRRRKIKCDEGEPSCERCIKSGRECEGYAKGPVFLNRTAQGLKRRDHLEEVLPRGSEPEARSVSHDPSYSSQTLDSLFIAEGSKQRTSSQDSRSQDVSPSTQSGSVISRSDVTSPEPLAPLRANHLPLTRYNIRQAIIEEYFAFYDMHSTPIGKWMVYALELPEWGELFTISLLALAHSRIGWARSDGELTVSGRNFYGKALLTLQQALQDPLQAVKDQTLAACQTMKFYEACESTEASVSSYDSHVHGIVRVLLYRGPSRNTTLLSKAVIQDIRYGALLTSIQGRRRNVIGGAEWRKETWENAADVEQALIDRGYDLAAVAEDGDRSLSFSPTEVVLTHYLERVLAIGKDLQYWYAAASKYLNFSNAHWLDPLPTARPGVDFGALDNSPVDVKALHESLLVTHFRALTIVLAVLVRSLRSKLVSGPSDVLAEADTYDLSLQYRLGHLIMDQLSYNSRPMHGLATASRCIFPTRCASHPARFNNTPEAAQLLARVDASIKWLSEGRGIRHAAVVLDAGRTWGDTGVRPRTQAPYETLSQPSPDADVPQAVRLIDMERHAT